MDRKELKPGDLAGKLALVTSAVFAMVGLFSMGLTLPSMSRAYAGSSEAWLIPWIGSIPAPAFAITCPFMGNVMSRVDSKHVYVVCLLLFVVFGCAPIFLSDLATILATRVLLGASVAGIVMSSLYRISHFPDAQRANLFGLQELVGSTTALIIFPLVGALVKFGSKVPFSLHAVGLLFLPIVLRLRPDSPGRGPSAHLEKLPERRLLGGLDVALCAYVAIVGSELFLNTIVTPYYLVGIGINDPTVASIPLSASVASTMIGASCYGLLHRRTGTLTVFILGSVAISIGLILCGVSRTLTSFTIGAFIVGGGLSISVANICTAAAQSNRAAPGKALGIVIGILYLAPIALPPFVAAIQQLLGASGPFIVFGLVSACWAVFFALTPPPILDRSIQN